jgi:CPA2 family monovalent cation:H+ antiporter-2
MTFQVDISPGVLMAAQNLPFLAELAALFAAAVLIAYACYRFGLVPIAGFLLAGVLIGPGALGLVSDETLINTLAEVGVILLLFTIGIEFSFEKIARLSRAILLGGGLQVGATVAVVTLLLLALGVDLSAGLYTGCLIALSSTAIVLGLLAERGETDSVGGRLALAILIFQDFAIIAMVLLVPMLAGQGGSLADVLLALGEAIALVVAVLLLARVAVPRLLDLVARSRRRELFLLTVVTVCLGTTWIASLADVSLALGAFLAGLVVSESQYRTHALSEILPLQTIFSAVFFVSVGLLLDVGFLIQNPLLVIGVAAAVLLLKVIITAGSTIILRYPVRIAVIAGLALAQVGEFSFVLDRVGRAAGLSPAGLGTVGEQTFIAVTVLLMMLTPFLLKVGPGLGRKLESSALGRIGPRPEEPGLGTVPKMEDHVIVVGFGPIGKRLVRVLSEAGIPHVVVDLDPRAVDDIRRAGISAVFGDAVRAHVLEHARIHTAKLCVVATNDDDSLVDVVRLAHYLNPTLQIIARTRLLDQVETLEDSGADIVVPEELETAVRIFSHVLGAYMVPPEVVSRQIQAIRADDYGIFRGSIQEAHLMVLQGLDEEGLHTRAVAVRAGAPAAGKTLAELSLRNKFGITVLAVRRDGRTIGNPAGDFVVEPKDRLVLIGMADRFAACAGLFREPIEQDEPLPEAERLPDG